MKTNAKHFKVFRKECEKWIPLLGIMDWRIVIEHKDLEGEKNLAWSCINSSQKSCSLLLSRDWSDNKITNEAIKRCAFHEAFHVRLSVVDDMLTSRGYSTDEADKVLHGLIYIFENYIYGIGE